MPELFFVQVTGPPTRPVLTVSGELDIATAAQLRECLETVITADAAGVVVDCRRLQFCDAAGLSVLLAAARRLPEGLSLHRPPPVLRKVRHLLGLEASLPDAGPAAPGPRR